MSTSETTLHLEVPGMQSKVSLGSVDSISTSISKCEKGVSTTPIIDTIQPSLPNNHRKFANPSPLGLLATACTCFLLGLIIMDSNGVHSPNAVVGMALGYGGFVQIIAGIQEWVCGNTFAATAFSSYGAFWFSWAALCIPIFGIEASYSTRDEYHQALALYNFSWGAITFLFLIATLRSSIPLVGLFLALTSSFFTSAFGYMYDSVPCYHAGGAFSVITSIFAAYLALGGLLTNDTSYFTLPIGDLSRKVKA